jgi:hypothetical protein
MVLLFRVPRVFKGYMWRSTRSHHSPCQLCRFPGSMPAKQLDSSFA